MYPWLLVLLGTLSLILAAYGCPTSECYCFQGQEIDCSDMSFKYLPHFEPENHTYGLLSMGMNRFKRLDGNVFQGVSIRRIHMVENRRKDLMVHADFLRGLEASLMYIYFYKNKISSLPITLFAGMGQLKQIDVIHCGLHSLAHNNFRGAVNATSLSLQDNDIAELPARAFSGLRSLKELKLSNNGIKQVDSLAFRGLKELEKLHLQHNNIRDLQPKMFRKTPKLEHLDLNDNNITALFPLMFKGLHELKTLNLANNPIELIADNTFKGLARVEKLVLTSANLRSLRQGMFRGMKSLIRLYLTSNFIVDMPDKIFAYNPVLSQVSLDNNQLTTINPCAFDDITAVKEINVWRNNIHCDCSLKWTTLETTPHVRGKCSSPAREMDQDIDDTSRYTVCTFSGMECGEEDIEDDMNTPLKFWLRYRRAYRGRAPYLWYGRKK